MRALLTSVLIATAVASGGAQAPPEPPPQTQTPPKPALQPAETIARSTTTTMTVQATDGTGATLAGVDVRATGPVAREGKTAEDGTARFQRVQAGNYRLRFARDGFITLERDVTVRSGQPLRIDVTLSAAPPGPPPAPCAEAAKREETEPGARPAAGPPGEPKTVALPTFIELNFIGRAPRRDSRLGCVGSGAGTLVQLREAITEQVYDTRDLWLYVVAGEGVLRVTEKEDRLAAGTFSVVPRTMRHSILPRGKNPLILLVIETGQACEGM